MRHLACLFMLCIVFLLGGCKSELYSGLSEKEANAMLALLQKNQISVNKVVGKGGKVTIRVSDSQQAEAIGILNRSGFPREQFDTVPSLFPQDSLIKSPLEEQARFTYAKSQELAATLSEIDGVLSARVHLVLPQPESKRGRSDDQGEATASVFIKHNANIDVGGYTPQIKLLVSKAVSGLGYDNISVAFFPSEVSADSAAERSWSEFLFIKVEKSSYISLIVLIVALLFLAAIGPAGLYFWYRRQGQIQQGSEQEQAPVQVQGNG